LQALHVPASCIIVQPCYRIAARALEGLLAGSINRFFVTLAFTIQSVMIACMREVCTIAFLIAATPLVASATAMSEALVTVQTTGQAGTVEQRNAELDQLFATLQTQASSSETFRAEQKIWQLWMQSDSAADDLVLSDATQAMDVGNYGGCERLLNQLLTKNAGYAEAWNKRATLYFLMGRFDESLSDIVKTLDLEPRHFGALSGRGMILQRQGKMREALVAYREALSMNPHMPGTRAAVQMLESLLPEL
jgi:tetratricopeptide (TPR) repeat protein